MAEPNAPSPDLVRFYGTWAVIICPTCKRPKALVANYLQRVRVGAPWRCVRCQRSERPAP